MKHIKICSFNHKENTSEQQKMQIIKINQLNRSLKKLGWTLN